MDEQEVENVLRVEPTVSKMIINVKHVVLIAALLFFSYFTYTLIQPYLNPIILAFIISLMIQPAYKWVLKQLNGRHTVAALLSTIILTVVIFIPVIFVLLAIIGQGVIFFQNTYTWINGGGVNEFIQHPSTQHLLTMIKNIVHVDLFDTASIVQRLTTLSATIGATLLTLSKSIIGNISHFLIHFILMLFVLFFLLRDHEKIMQSFHHVLPLSRTQEDRLFDEIELVATSAVLGSFLTALTQGVLGGVAMAICGLPALFWGSMIGFASFIPVIGTTIIWIPIAIYLGLTGHWGLTTFLFVWGILVIGSIDNVVRPLFMSGRGSMDTLLIFLSLLSGISYFGLIGLIYGPLIFSITIVFFRLYEKEFKTFLDQQDIT